MEREGPTKEIKLHWKRGKLETENEETFGIWGLVDRAEAGNKSENYILVWRAVSPMETAQTLLVNGWKVQNKRTKYQKRLFWRTRIRCIPSRMITR